MADSIKADPLLVNVKKNVCKQTYEAYCARLARLVAATKKTLMGTVQDAKRSNVTLQRKYDSVTTRRNVLDAVMALFIHNPELVSAESQAFEAWSRKQRVLRGLVQKAREDNRMTPELKAKHIDLAETRKIAERLRKVVVGKAKPTGALKHLTKYRLSQDYLLLLLMVDVPPKRADLGELVVVRSSDPVPRTGNYVQVPETGAVTLVMNDYKTAKYYKKFEEELPANVSQAIRESLDTFPRAHLFTGAHERPLSDSSYAEMVKRVFKRHTGKPAGINALRHAYITQKADHGKVTLGELKAMAKSMGHSIGMQSGYQLVQGGASAAGCVSQE